MKLRSTCITIACTVLASASTSIKPKAMKLTTTAIKLTDGKFVRWQEFALMLTVRKEIVGILHGTLVDGVRVGHYLVNGILYTLEQLLELEEHYKKNKNEVGLTQLEEVLKKVKKDLQANLGRYIALARGAKGPLLILIDESCKKHGKKQSILHNWGSVKDGQEEEQMEKDLASFSICRGFCVDLINFLEDMMYSCEKARAQYKKEMERRLNKR